MARKGSTLYPSFGRVQEMDPTFAIYVLHVCSPLLVTICTSFKVNRGLVIVQLKFVIVNFDGDYSTVTVFL